jgi:hypothetical protein
MSERYIEVVPAAGSRSGRVIALRRGSPRTTASASTSRSCNSGDGLHIGLYALLAFAYCIDPGPQPPPTEPKCHGWRPPCCRGCRRGHKVSAYSAPHEEEAEAEILEELDELAWEEQAEIVRLDGDRRVVGAEAEAEVVAEAKVARLVAEAEVARVAEAERQEVALEVVRQMAFPELRMELNARHLDALAEDDVLRARLRKLVERAHEKDLAKLNEMSKKALLKRMCDVSRWPSPSCLG